VADREALAHAFGGGWSSGCIDHILGRDTAYRRHAQAWFDRQMRALERFDVTVTFCFTPESAGVRPHHTSPPVDTSRFAEFCAAQVRRYS